MTEDIKRNFGFVYYGKGRHLFPDDSIANMPLRTLMELGGKERLSISEHGLDEISEGYHRGFSFEFKIIQFSGHTIEAYYTKEGAPEMSENPLFVTRIRLANYDYTDSFTKPLS